MKRKIITLIGYIAFAIAAYVTVDLVPEFVVKRPDTTSHIQENILHQSFPKFQWDCYGNTSSANTCE